MVKKGLIDTSMTEDEIQEFLTDQGKGQDSCSVPPDPVTSKDPVPNETRKGKDNQVLSNESGNNLVVLDKVNVITNALDPHGSSSEATIYKRAVHQVAPNLEKQIDEFINKTRLENESRKLSTSSEEYMDTSDKTNDENFHSILGRTKEMELQAAVEQYMETVRPLEPIAEKVITPEQHADDLIKKSELSKATMFGVQGKQPNSVNLLAIDNDYQMIDSHICHSCGLAGR